MVKKLTGFDVKLINGRATVFRSTPGGSDGAGVYRLQTALYKINNNFIGKQLRNSKCDSYVQALYYPHKMHWSFVE